MPTRTQYIPSTDLKQNVLYFLFVSCRLFLKRKLLALQITISIVFWFLFFALFFSLQACQSLSLAFFPFLPSIASFLPSFPLSLTTRSLFYHWCVREKRTGKRRRRKRGRWPAFYLSVYLFVCLSYVHRWLIRKWLSVSPNPFDNKLIIRKIQQNQNNDIKGKMPFED